MLTTRIETKLQAAFSPSFLKVEDESHLHKGHANYRAGESTHFKITIVSSKFSNLTRIQRHQLVYACLEEEFKAGLHALCLKTLSPEEAEAASSEQA
jgi:BolA protein